ncbi:MAG: hypothetical protein JOZ78_23995 [Chroococcidiopsidaceae cyanobacterium CP_BM_ER_R8_30]|nr:hypothetical protein [Chroococcidiopsidaceae cyanobacterium CP_BM_ER_R8_30]
MRQRYERGFPSAVERCEPEGVPRRQFARRETRLWQLARLGEPLRSWGFPPVVASGVRLA